MTVLQLNSFLSGEERQCCRSSRRRSLLPFAATFGLADVTAAAEGGDPRKEGRKALLVTT